MGATKLMTAAGGGITLDAASTASDKTITVPADNGTLVYANSSGNVGIGTSSPSQELHVYRSSGATDILIEQASSGNAYLHTKNTSREYAIGTRTDALAFYDITADAERARITANGELLVGCTSSANLWRGTAAANGIQIAASEIDIQNSSNAIYISKASGYTNSSHIEFWINGVGRGSIATTGTSTNYNTSSDYRLKENIVPMTGALAKVAQLKPCTYTWKENGSAGEGFIAHELQEVVPDCVTGEKDAVDEDGNPKYQGIDTSFLVATLTAAIQELKAELDAAKADIAALKGTA